MDLLIFKPDHAIDVITNSSSELFVLESETPMIVEEMVASVYPEWSSEYRRPRNISELTTQELNEFVYYHCSPHMWPCSDKSRYPLLPGYSFDELYELEKDRYGGGSIAHYTIINNVPGEFRTSSWDKAFVTEQNRQEFIARACPKRNWYFMYSLGENPNYEMQEVLSEVGSRYHLG